jgi:hypothetical protein
MNQNHKARRAFARFTIALTLGGIGRSNQARGETSAGQTGTIRRSKQEPIFTMKRRTFIKTGGVTTLSACLPGQLAKSFPPRLRIPASRPADRSRVGGFSPSTRSFE